MKIFRCHITNNDQGSSKRLQKASDYKSKGQIKILGISNCPTAVLSLPPLSSPFSQAQTTTNLLPGSFEKNGGDTEILTFLTDN